MVVASLPTEKKEEIKMEKNLIGWEKGMLHEEDKKEK